MGLYKSGGGGALSETTLWTNPSPTSARGETTISLSESFKNFKLVRFYYKISKSSSSEFYTDYLSEMVEQATQNLNKAIPAFMVFPTSGGVASYCRSIRYVSDTSFIIKPAYALNAVATNNDLAIITKICGLK